MTVKKAGPEEVDKISIADLRNILIIAGIYLFFTGWIYTYYFYDYFGMSASLVSTDYSAYIVYSFMALISYWGLPLVGLMGLIFLYRKWLKKYTTLSICIALLLFPGLCVLAIRVANDKAVQLRRSRTDMRQISFVFRDDAGFLAFKYNKDSLPVNDLLVKTDLALLKDSRLPGKLFLLGQNQEYFFVLYQPSETADIKGLPLGSIFFINKNYVLYSKITVTSNEKK